MLELIFLNTRVFGVFSNLEMGAGDKKRGGLKPPQKMGKSWGEPLSPSKRGGEYKLSKHTVFRIKTKLTKY